MEALHRIVVVGGGAGGLELVSMLGRKLGKQCIARPILVDSIITHIWKPLLHEVATGALNTGEDAVNYFSHAHETNYEFELGRMNGLDRKNKSIRLAVYTDEKGKILTKERYIKYNTLVLAVGSTSNDFGTPGVRKFCFTLDSAEDAERLRIKMLWQAFRVSTGDEEKVRIAIVGGGPTGVELAAEIHHTFTAMRAYGAHIEPNQLEITLLEGAPRILGASTEAISNAATEALLKRKVDVRVKCGVKSATDSGFILSDGSLLKAEIRIWAAGVKAPTWLSKLGLKVTPLNQLYVNDMLETEDPHIHAMGDCAFCPDGQGKFTPPTAQGAHQQAVWLCKKLVRRAKGDKSRIEPFRFTNKGIIVSLGSETAVANLIPNLGIKENVGIHGKSAKFLYESLYRMHQVELFGVRKTFILWLAGVLRNTSLPQTKFH